MALTPAQLATLKAAILADQALASQPMDGDGNAFIADYYNAIASPDFMVWRTEAPVNNILDAITFTSYTPADSPEASGMFTARALVIQTKQMNLQNLMLGRTAIDASKANIRAALRDAVVGLPAGAGGAAVSAGGASGATVLAACLRKARRIEQLYNAGNATTGTTTAALMGYEGTVNSNDIDAARHA